MLILIEIYLILSIDIMSVNIVQFRSLEKAPRAKSLIGDVVFFQSKFYDGKGPRGRFGKVLSLDKKYRRDGYEGFFCV